MKNIIKYIFLFILIVIFVYAFSSSYKSQTIDNLAYVIAIGVDNADNNKIKVSFQFIENSVFSDSGSSDSSSTIIDTVEASSIDTAINLLNTYIGKEINLAHCKVVVFSETVATNGLSDHVYRLINNSQLRPTTNIIVSRCDAKYYIENSTSKYEKVITKYYDIFPKSADYTGYTANVTIGDFFNKLNNNDSNPVAILGGVNTKTTESAPQEDTSSQNEDFNILANESSITGDRGTENIGLAIFKKDKLVGELSAIETLCHSLITGKTNSFLISIPNPENTEKNIDISVSDVKDENVDIDISNGSPYVYLNLKLDARILSIENNKNYLESNYLNMVSENASKYLEERITEYLYKTSTELNSCVDNFYPHVIGKFLTFEDWKAYNWTSNYQNCFFDVDVNINIVSSLLLTENN